MNIVYNSSPLIFLARLGFLEKAMGSCDHCYLPKAVADEIEVKQDDASFAIKRLIVSHGIAVKDTALISLAQKLFQRLGRGEAHAIALAVELQADFVILDDVSARKEATRLGVNVKGTLAIIKKLQSDQAISLPPLDELYAQLLAIHFRVKRHLFNEIFRA